MVCMMNAGIPVLVNFSLLKAGYCPDPKYRNYK